MENKDNELLLPIENNEELNKGARCDRFLRDFPFIALSFKIEQA